MPQPERGPRLEKARHLAAEERVKESVLRRERGQEWRYPDRDADLELLRRKSRELGPERLRRVLDRGGA